MIPKIIHFCWMSGEEFPDKIQHCIDTWKEHLPDYELRLWDAKRFDVHSVKWCEQAFERKKYAFVADYIRFFALHQYGGIYFDSDVEVIKNFDDLLSLRSFIGYEYCSIPEAAVLGAEKGVPWLKDCMEFYQTHDFIDQHGSMRMSPVPLLIKKKLEERYHIQVCETGRQQRFPDGVIFPYFSFSPKNPYSNRISLRADTYCIHNFVTAWKKKGFLDKFVVIAHRIIYALIGKRVHDKLFYFYWRWPYQEKIKLLLVGTNGGHLTELLTLFDGLKGIDMIIFSEKSRRLSAIPHRSYSYSRPHGEILTMIVSGMKALYIILRERPDWIVTSGAECGVAALIVGKLLFRKTMFLETASRCRTKTMAAKICYPLADKFYVQHEEALAIYGKKAEYIGGVL